jgi:type II secretory pathway pseudopilin PulG
MNSKVLRPRADAFTLVEVMVAAAVMVLGLVGMIQAVVSGSEMLDVARKQTVAMQIIHGQIDNIRLSNWTTVSALADYEAAVDATDQSTNIAKGFVFGSNLPTVGKGFKCARAITAPKTNLVQVTFTVKWTGKSGRSYARTGSTYVSKNGLYVTYQR